MIEGLVVADVVDESVTEALVMAKVVDESVTEALVVAERHGRDRGGNSSCNCLAMMGLGRAYRAYNQKNGFCQLWY